ncbi:MAG: glycosyl hydrolase [Thermoguttaceae bacterium]
MKRVTYIIASQTMMKVKRAAYGAEGYVIDHYNPAVIDKFIKQIAEPEVKSCGSNSPYSVFCDSLESAGEDWTANIFEEFKKRRGYDLRPHLAALIYNTSAKARDIRHDWGKTLTEMCNDYFIAGIEKWAKANGTKFRLQAYGTPPAALYSYAYADLGEGEGYNWKGFRETRWASSANHLLGRPISSSETWTWLHSPVFRASPLDVKAEADLHFLQGVNQLIGHGWPYSPPEAKYPGWRFYASMVFSEKNPWWIVMPEVAKYLERVSFMMREGRPANDVALYLADSDAWASFVPGRVAMNGAVSRRLGREVVRQILESGYNLDFFDDGLLDMRGKVDGGALSFGDLKYKVVVLSGVERIPTSTMRKLDEFVKGGGILIATRSIPSIAPGFKATDEDQKTVKEIAQRLFEDENSPGIFLESDRELGKALAKHLTPDVKFEPAAPEIGFVHRKTESADIYFLANTGNTPKKVKAAFRVQAMQPEKWDPMTGQVEAVDVVSRDNNLASINLNLEPYASPIIVFTKRTLPAAQPAAQNASKAKAIDLSDGWSVSFGKDSKPVTIDKLTSWTENDATRYFSGVAVYEKKVKVPSAMLKQGLAVQLSLGEAKVKTKTDDGQSKAPADINEPPRPQSDTADAIRAPTRPGPRMQAMLDAPVREAAVVYVNGKRAGSVWCPPYCVDVSGLLHDGENDIRIEVANLAINYMADFKNHPLPDYSALNARYGERFQPQDMKQVKPVPSGLLGPIKIIATEKTTQ